MAAQPGDEDLGRCLLAVAFQATATQAPGSISSMNTSRCGSSRIQRLARRASDVETTAGQQRF
ncbi:hypothetical protein [Mesorhizobium sp. 43Arga]